LPVLSEGLHCFDAILGGKNRVVSPPQADAEQSPQSGPSSTTNLVAVGRCSDWEGESMLGALEQVLYQAWLDGMNLADHPTRVKMPIVPLLGLPDWTMRTCEKVCRGPSRRLALRKA
jgi:hypothetical protein